MSTSGLREMRPQDLREKRPQDFREMSKGGLPEMRTEDLSEMRTQDVREMQDLREMRKEVWPEEYIQDVMIILKYFVNHNYYDLMTLCCFCDDSLITLGWYVYDLGIMLGPLWGHIGLLFASL